MKIFRTLTATFLATLLLLCVTPRALALEVTITLHEDGQGSIQNTLGNLSPLSHSIASDPGPGGLASALTFDLFNPPGLVAGDLILLDAGGNISDIIRFNPAGTGSPSYLGSALFYSMAIPGGGELAETGFPTLLYGNNLQIPENLAGPTTYTPSSGQPGYVAGSLNLVSYVMFSAEGSSAVPDGGSSALLMGVALLGIAVAGRLLHWSCLLSTPIRIEAVSRSRRID